MRLPSAGAGIQADAALSRPWMLTMTALTALVIGGATVASRRAPRLASASRSWLPAVRVRAGALTRTGRCRHCAGQLSPRDNFCSGCGAALLELAPRLR